MLIIYNYLINDCIDNVPKNTLQLIIILKGISHFFVSILEKLLIIDN